MMRTVARMATLVATMAAVAIATVPAQAGAVRDVVTERLSQRLFPLFDGMARARFHRRHRQFQAEAQCYQLDGWCQLRLQPECRRLWSRVAP